MVGTNLTPRTRYHPQDDGKTNRVNQWLEGYLRNYVSGQQKSWIKWLHLGEFCYNNTFHMSIDMSHLNKFMVMMHPLLLTTFFVVVELARLRIGLKKVKKFWRFWEITCRLLKIRRNNMQTNIEWRYNSRWMTWCIWGCNPTNKPP